MAEKRGILAEDLYELKSVADPNLSPNGEVCVFVETSIIKEKHEYRSNLFMLNVPSNELQQWTYGDFRNHSPRWSNDGKKLVFVSNRTGKNQLYILNANGGEAQRLTDLHCGASNPVWSPDGKKIAFSVVLKKGETLEKENEKKEQDEKVLHALEVDRMKYKSDSSGFFEGKYQQIAILNVETNEVELVTEGERHYSFQSWSPDGTYIAYSTDTAEDVDFSFKNDLFIYQLETKKVEQITNGTGYFGGFEWSPNGKYAAFFGSEREFENATLTRLWMYEVESKTVTCITNDWDVAVGDLVVGDFQQGVNSPGALWKKDSSGVFFTASDHGNTNVYFSDLHGEIQQVTKEQGHVYGLTISKDGSTAVATVSYPTKPSDVYRLDLHTGKLEPLTNINGEFLSSIILSDAEPIQFEGAEGWTVHGWMMKPVGYEEGKKYPLILEIHGGPHAMYANTYFHEFQMLAAQGFAVLFTNPRGSHGYGQKFVDAVRGDYGGNDYNDLMAAVDYAIETFSFVDRDRLGVTGGSYGGFMTNWIVGHTNRFKAAVTQRSISNWVSFYGVSDIGYYFSEWQIKADLSDIGTLWKHSPLAYADQIETPLLILHSEKDYRCPIEQAEQLFIALKRKKKETKFVRFPNSNHELSRSGNPKLRVDRLNYIKDWFLKYV